MTDVEHQQVRGSWTRAAGGGLLSLAIPGLGQVYARSWRLGIGLLAVMVLLQAAALVLARTVPPVPLFVVIGVCLSLISGAVLCIGSAIDAVRRIRLHPDRTHQPWFRSTWFVAIMSVALLAAIRFEAQEGWRTFSIPSNGDAPTLTVGDLLFADARNPSTTLAPGDTVIFRHPHEPSMYYIKRAIGLPGDIIRLTEGVLYINGTAVPRTPDGEYAYEENGVRIMLKRYTETLPNGRSYSVVKATDDGKMNNTDEYRVPDNSFFVLGDNRDDSVDSRFDVMGYIPKKNLVGRATTIYWSRTLSRVLQRIY